MIRSLVRAVATERPPSPATSVLIAGAPPGHAAGNAVSTAVLLEALRPLGSPALVTHRLSPFPTLEIAGRDGAACLQLGAQPLALHAEASLAGRVHRRALRRWSFAWVINSRYASGVDAAGLPFALWEPTTIRDELRVTDARADRRSGRGSGLGNRLHRALLPLDESLERRLYRRAVAIFAMSRYTQERIIEIHRLPREQVVLLEHPPAPEFLSALSECRNAGRSAARDVIGRRPGDEALRLLFVGRADDPRKNVPLLLDALARLLASGRRVALTIVGPYTPGWAGTVAEHPAAPAVTLRGRIDTHALAEAYLEHDLFVLPSRQEGFGIVVAEALHAGLPVVSTRCGGPEEVLRESQAGALTPLSSAAFADAVESIASDPERMAAMRARARRYAEERLSFDRFAVLVRERTIAELRVPRG